MATMPKNVDKIVPQFPSFFNDNFADSLTQNELDKTVNMYLGRMMFRRLSSINQGYYLGHSFYFNGDISYDADFLNKLKNVSLEQVKSLAKKYLKVENPLTLIVR
jgi:predicted Zn-dependent peptidase